MASWSPPDLGAAVSIACLGTIATGVGWTLGIGRTGSIAGPLLGGVLIGAGLPVSTLCLVIAVPAVLASILVSC